MVPLAGLEPALPAPEASALSSELQGHRSIILLLKDAFNTKKEFLNLNFEILNNIKSPKHKCNKRFEFGNLGFEFV